MNKFNIACNQLHEAMVDPLGDMHTTNPIEAVERVRNRLELVKMECGEGAANEAMIHSYVMAMYRQRGNTGVAQ